MVDRSPLFLSSRNLVPAMGRRLRAGVVTESKSPLWTRAFVEYLTHIPHLEIFTFSIPEKTPAKAIPPLTRRVYDASKQRFDPFASVGIVPGEAAGIESLKGAGLDVLVWLAPVADLPGHCSNLASFGALTVQLGDQQTEPPYWGEALKGQLTSSTAVYWHASSANRARLVRTAEINTVGGVFFTRNAEEPLVAVNRMIAGVLLDIVADGERWKERMLATPEVDRYTSPREYPSNVASLAFVTKQVARSVRLRLQERGRRFTWFTAIRRRPQLFYSNTGRFSNEGWEEVPVSSPGNEIADPFVFERNGKTWLFYEDLPTGASKAHLSCLEVTADGFGEPHVILKQPYHLSYPCVFEDRGEVFMLPETSEDGKVQLYRATRFPYEFEPAAILMEGVALVDTTPFLLDGIWYFFTTTPRPFMETFLFCSDSLDGKWRMHPGSPVSSVVSNSRSAGQLFYGGGGRLLRPTQDCVVRYGHAMTINEIKRLTPSEFEESGVDSIQPDWMPGLLGTHTLNSSPTLEVVDAIRYAE